MRDSDTWYGISLLVVSGAIVGILAAPDSDIGAKLKISIDVAIGIIYMIASGVYFLEIRPRMPDSSEGTLVVVDDLQNPVVWLEVQKERKAEVEELVKSTKDGTKALGLFPRLKAQIDTLTLMNEREAYLKKFDMKVSISGDWLHFSGFAEREHYVLRDIAEELANSTVDLMTIHKGAKMLRTIESRKEEKRKQSEKPAKVLDWQETMK